MPIKVEISNNHHCRGKEIKVVSGNSYDQFITTTVLSDHAAMLMKIPFGDFLDLQVKNHLYRKADAELKAWRNGR